MSDRYEPNWREVAISYANETEQMYQRNLPREPEDPEPVDYRPRRQQPVPQIAPPDPWMREERPW